MTKKEFKPGFRMSVFDTCVLAIGTSAVFWCIRQQWPIAFAIAFVVLHFFLFCNVFRFSRSSELIWAGIFAGLETLRLTSGKPSLLIVIVLSISATVALVAVEFRKPSYHGVLWRKINPNLKTWFEASPRE